MMLEVFFVFSTPILGSLLIAVSLSSIGVFVITKRVVFVGLALAQVAACGVAFSFFLGISVLIGSFAFAIPAALLLSQPFSGSRITREAMLGILFVAASAMTYIFVANSGVGLAEIENISYGYLLLLNDRDLSILALVLLPILAIYYRYIKRFLFCFFDRDAALLAGLNVKLFERLYFLLLAGALAVSLYSAGLLLTFSYLVVAPATGLILAKRLLGVLLVTTLSSVITTVFGFYFSYLLDIATSQVIAAMCVLLFVVAYLAQGFIPRR